MTTLCHVIVPTLRILFASLRFVGKLLHLSLLRQVYSQLVNDGILSQWNDIVVHNAQWFPFHWLICKLLHSKHVLLNCVMDGNSVLVNKYC